MQGRANDTAVDLINMKLIMYIIIGYRSPKKTIIEISVVSVYISKDGSMVDIVI